jgi:hypothetical protein
MSQKSSRMYAGERFDLICIQFIRVRACRAAERHGLFRMVLDALDADLAKWEIDQKGCATCGSYDRSL